MNSSTGFERCLSFINCQLQPAPHSLSGTVDCKFTAVTISRQAGSGGHEVAQKLSQQLQDGQSRPGSWAVFDRNLVEKALQDHNLPTRLARFMPEDHVSEIADIMDELFGLHPPSWTLVRKTSQTILHLAHRGNVILIGRGANVITSRLPHVFHVRLVGSLAKRILRLQKANGIGQEEAWRIAKHEDLARQRYLKQFFNKDIDDPLLYHLVINTDLMTIEEIVRLIASEMCSHPVAAAA